MKDIDGKISDGKTAILESAIHYTVSEMLAVFLYGTLSDLCLRSRKTPSRCIVHFSKFVQKLAFLSVTTYRISCLAPRHSAIIRGWHDKITCLQIWLVSWTVESIVKWSTRPISGGKGTYVYLTVLRNIEIKCAGAAAPYMAVFELEPAASRSFVHIHVSLCTCS